MLKSNLTYNPSKMDQQIATIADFFSDENVDLKVTDPPYKKPFDVFTSFKEYILGLLG